MYILICFLPCLCQRYRKYLPGKCHCHCSTFVVLMRSDRSTTIVLYLLFRFGVNEHERSDRNEFEHRQCHTQQCVVSPFVFFFNGAGMFLTMSSLFVFLVRDKFNDSQWKRSDWAISSPFSFICFSLVDGTIGIFAIFFAPFVYYQFVRRALK